MRKLKLIIIIIFAATIKSAAQDPHFSQTATLGAWYNPATTGMSSDPLRITAVYRNQWAGITSPFKTEGIFAEKRVNNSGYGLYFVNNSAGPSGFRQMFLGGQYAGGKTLGKHVFNAGLQIGIIQRSFDPSQMTFDEQYLSDQGFDASHPITENFNSTRSIRPDLSCGFNWLYGDITKDKLLPQFGFAVHHLNTPKEEFISQEIPVHSRITFNSGIGIRLSDVFLVTPSVQYMIQDKSSQWLTQLRTRMRLNDLNAIEGMISMRNTDEITIGTSYKWNQYAIGMSYDVRMSGFNNTPGSFELTLVYTPAARSKNTAVQEIQYEEEEVIELSIAEELKLISPLQINAWISDNVVNDEPVSVTRVHTTIASLPIITDDNIDDLTPLPNMPIVLQTENHSTADLPKSVFPLHAAIPLIESDENEFPTEITSSNGQDLNVNTSSYIDQKKTIGTAEESEASITVAKKVADNAIIQSSGVPATVDVELTQENTISFAKQSTDVHGLYKLDVIEPGLDILNTDDQLQLELIPEGKSQQLNQKRLNVVRSIFVSKGLAPGRIRIVSDERNTDFTKSGNSPVYRECVRVRIVRVQ